MYPDVKIKHRPHNIIFHRHGFMDSLKVSFQIPDTRSMEENTEATICISSVRLYIGYINN